MAIFRAVGKFKLIAQKVKVKLASTKIKQLLVRWVRNWRKKRQEPMRQQFITMLREKSKKVSTALKIAQEVYRYVVFIQRTFRRFLIRKKFIMCVYSMQWITQEKRYLAMLKRSESAVKGGQSKASISELMRT